MMVYVGADADGAHLIDGAGHAAWQADSGPWLEVCALHRLHYFLISCSHAYILPQV